MDTLNVSHVISVTTQLADPKVDCPGSDTLSINVRRCLLDKKVFIQIVSFSNPFWSSRIDSRKCTAFQLPEFEMFYANNYNLVVDQTGAIWHD